jgi:hypothetical protein
VTHDPEVGAACDRIVRMRDGLVVGDERTSVSTQPAELGSPSPPTGYTSEPSVAFA